ncbi:membrane protein implicated in regulation of membrane protease activity [Catenuloplanes nepalensis]|uniref:Membrane protein implicated in regulation of membrane protease activity n=1 Tax=Catenuloplanes nepalensis TaxID=587533 RepID=A0ABT9MMD4_9ACTN|nr:NfeD family protein [Catenuloplanes nepalensis]MDP9792201.1 membrane protein implicated in regulation of membrane protease activity [Catenuloplanes nepalensis]
MEPFLWIALGAVLAVAEIFTVSLFLIMFAAGAFAAAGAAALGFGVAVQLAVFAGVSAATVAAFWPLIRRHRLGDADGDDPHHFDARGVEGETALVLDRVDGEHGQVKIGGELWNARPFDDTEAYEAGERVRVIKVQGATVYVWREGIGPASRTELEE